MSDVEQYRRKAAELLELAARASTEAERGRLIDLAAKWHKLAQDTEAREPPPDPEASGSED